MCNINECIDITTRELANIEEWAKDNGLALSPLKSSCLVICKKMVNSNRLREIKLNNSTNGHTHRLRDVCCL